MLIKGPHFSGVHWIFRFPRSLALRFQWLFVALLASICCETGSLHASNSEATLNLGGSPRFGGKQGDATPSSGLQRILRSVEHVKDRSQVWHCRGGRDFDGGDAFAVDVEGGYVESTLADPEMTQVRAFMPKAARRTVIHSRPHQHFLIGFSFSDIDLFGRLAWFYPEPPWGRKDVYRRGSRFLKVWHIVVWIAMVYVAIVVPFRAAGFRHESAFEMQTSCLDYTPERSAVDAVVDCIFAADMFFSLHTAYYKGLGSGRFVLVEDLPSVKKHYLQSQNFLLDLMGLLPFTEMFCLCYSALKRFGPSGAPDAPPPVFGIFKVLRLFNLFRLHHFRSMWNFFHHHFPRKSRALELSKLLTILAFAGHLLCCAWYWIGTQAANGWVSKLAPDAPWDRKYITSLYFVYATMTTVGYGDVSGTTLREKMFSVWNMVVGSFLFGVILGSVPKIYHNRAEAVTRYQTLETNVREYLQEHKVPVELRGRILQYYEYRFPHRRRHDLHKMIRELPRSIQEDLSVHVYRDVIRMSLLLSRCSPSTVSDVCLRFRVVCAARGDHISVAGTEADGVYFIRSGQVVVMRGGVRVQRLKPGDAFGENCLLDVASAKEPRRMHTVSALEPVEMVKLYREDVELLVAEHHDFTLTYDIRQWPAVRRYLISRRNERIGKRAHSVVLESIQKLCDEVETIKLAKHPRATPTSSAPPESEPTNLDADSSAASAPSSVAPPIPAPAPRTWPAPPSAALNVLSTPPYNAVDQAAAAASSQAAASRKAWLPRPSVSYTDLPRPSASTNPIPIPNLFSPSFSIDNYRTDRTNPAPPRPPTQAAQPTLQGPQPEPRLPRTHLGSVKAPTGGGARSAPQDLPRAGGGSRLPGRNISPARAQGYTPGGDPGDEEGYEGSDEVVDAGREVEESREEEEGEEDLAGSGEKGDGGGGQPGSGDGGGSGRDDSLQEAGKRSAEEWLRRRRADAESGGRGRGPDGGPEGKEEPGEQAQGESAGRGIQREQPAPLGHSPSMMLPPLPSLPPRPARKEYVSVENPLDRSGRGPVNIPGLVQQHVKAGFKSAVHSPARMASPSRNYVFTSGSSKVAGGRNSHQVAARGHHQPGLVYEDDSDSR